MNTIRCQMDTLKTHLMGHEFEIKQTQYNRVTLIMNFQPDVFSNGSTIVASTPHLVRDIYRRSLSTHLQTNLASTSAPSVAHFDWFDLNPGKFW